MQNTPFLTTRIGRIGFLRLIINSKQRDFKCNVSKQFKSASQTTSLVE